MQNKPVLIVEDEPGIRENLVLLLELEGYEVYAACDGKEALDILGDPNRDLPGVIALDFFMPVMDAHHFLDALENEKVNRPELADVPIVLVTAADARLQQTIIGRVDGCLPKPLNLDTFLTTIAQYCSHNSLPSL